MAQASRAAKNLIYEGLAAAAGRIKSAAKKAWTEKMILSRKVGTHLPEGVAGRINQGKVYKRAKAMMKAGNPLTAMRYIEYEGRRMRK